MQSHLLRHNSEPRPGFRRARGLTALAAAILIFAAPLAAQESPKPPAATDAPAAPATPPAPPPVQPVPAKPATPPVDDSALLEKLTEKLKEVSGFSTNNPGPLTIRNKLDELIDLAENTARSAGGADLKLQSLSVQSQALYRRLTVWPDDATAEKQLLRLRSAARQFKTVKETQAVAIGDFWLLTASLLELNRDNLPELERNTQAIQMMEDYLTRHAKAEPAADVKLGLDRLKSHLVRTPLKAPPQPDPVSGANSGVAANPAPPANPAPMPPAPTPPTPAPAPVDIKPAPPAAPAVKPGDPTPPVKIDASGQPILQHYRLRGEPTLDKEHGWTNHSIQSLYQPGATTLRVLAPKEAAARAILFVLPVSSGASDIWGDGMSEIRKLNLHEKLGLIVVSPSFAQMPWYADHPTDARIQQESHMIKAVVPYVDGLHPKGADGKPLPRLLLGFSKSGWGAYSLLLRNQELFAAAAAWDSPLMQQEIKGVELMEGFGDQATLQKYFVPNLLKAHAERFRKTKRFVLMGHKFFPRDLRNMHALMNSLGVEHVYHDGPEREHRWDGGWLNQPLEELAGLAKPPAK